MQAMRRDGDDMDSRAGLALPRPRVPGGRRRDGTAMTPETLREAIKEAERFVRIAKKVGLGNAYTGGPVCVKYGVESAAAKRASMDLTRALARMRRYEQ